MEFLDQPSAVVSPTFLTIYITRHQGHLEGVLVLRGFISMVYINIQEAPANSYGSW